MKKTLLILALSAACSLPALAANLLTNGDFELSPIGASAPNPYPSVDGSTIADWRVFAVGTAPNVFSATIVDAGAYPGGTAGSKAMLLSIDLTNSPGGDRAVDRDNTRLPVVQGQQYILSFDAAVIGTPTVNLRVGFGEHNAGGTYVGAEDVFLPTLITDGAFHQYSYTWTASHVDTAFTNLAFRANGAGTLTMVFDNISFAPVPEPASASLLLIAGAAALSRRRRQLGKIC